MSVNLKDIIGLTSARMWQGTVELDKIGPFQVLAELAIFRGFLSRENVGDLEGRILVFIGDWVVNLAINFNSTDTEYVQ